MQMHKAYGFKAAMIASVSMAVVPGIERNTEQCCSGFTPCIEHIMHTFSWARAFSSSSAALPARSEIPLHPMAQKSIFLAFRSHCRIAWGPASLSYRTLCYYDNNNNDDNYYYF